jgi:hypothetical protein
MTGISILCVASIICGAYGAGTAVASASVSETDFGKLAVSRPNQQTIGAIALNPQPLPPRTLPPYRTLPPNRTTPKPRTKT